MSAGINSPFQLQDLITGMGAYHKLDGYLGFTGTFSLKVVWNSEPFTQGLYILGYVPPGAPLFNLQDSATTSLFFSTYLSGCHHVLLNIAESTSVTLDIPYVGPNTFIPLGNTDLPLLGNFYLVPIIPVASSVTLQKLDYNVYFAIKDLKTYGTYPAQAGITGSTFQSPEDLTSEALKKSKVISRTASSISSFIEKAGEYIPSSLVPSAYVKGAAFLTGGVSKIADLLGYSKPYSVVSINRVANVPYCDTTTSDAVFSGAKFAMNSDAGLGDIDLSGRGVDEMQISEVLSRFNFWQNFRWNASTTVNAIIADIDITPAAFQNAFQWHVSSGTTTAFINTQLSYLSAAFVKWRGSILFRLAIVATKFHSGRLRVVYIPEDSRSVVINSTQYMYTHIIDIRDPTTWEFEVPFISPTPWKENRQRSGILRIYVDTPLVASSSALDHVDICTFVAGGKTFEVAIPTKRNLQVPQYSYTPPAAIRESEFQSGIDVLDNRRLVHVSLAPEANSSSATAHSLAVGDPVRSLRALFRKFWIGTNPIWTTQTITQAPYPLVKNPNSQDTDMIAYCANLFAFWRGGLRIYAQNYYPCRVTTLSTDQVFPSSSTTSQSGGASYDYKTANSTAMVGMMEPTSFELPYSYSTLCRNTFIPYSSSNGETTQSILIDYYLGNPGSLLSRAMADDFTMGTLIGAPITIPR